MVRICAECLNKELLKEKPLKHKAIIGCYREGEKKDCILCRSRHWCSIRLVLPNKGYSSGLCRHCFEAAYLKLVEKRLAKSLK